MRGFFSGPWRIRTSNLGIKSCPFAGQFVLPQLVLRGLPSEAATAISEMPLELAVLHAAISTDSTRAQPVGGIASPRAWRSSRTSAIASLTISRA